MLKFTRGVHRIDINLHATGAQYTQHRDWKRHHIGCHQSNSIALFYAQRILQIGRKTAGQFEHFAVSLRRAEIAISDLVAEALSGFKQHIDDVLVRICVDLVRYP